MKTLNRMVIFAFLLIPTISNAQKFDEKFEHWPTDLKINGRIIITDGPELDEAALRTLRRVRRDREMVVLARAAVAEDQVTKLVKPFAGDDDNVEPVRFRILNEDSIKKSVGDAKVLALISGKKLSDEELAALQKSKPVLRKILDDRGSLIVDSHVAPALGYIMKSPTGKSLNKGLNLFFDCLVQTNFDDTLQNRAKTLKTLAANKRTVGIGISKNCLLMLSGRKIVCFGSGKSTFLLPPHNKYLKTRAQTIRQAKNRRQLPQEYLIDLTEWRRDSIDRTLPQFPADKPPTPHVKKGTLVIVGGGGMPRGLMNKIVELAGGVERAKMVYVPCSERDDVGERQRTVEMWKRMGVKHATFIHTKDRNKANTDKDFYAPLKDATGIWFGGGRQWNFADSYYGTKTHQLMKEVLNRGGVIGGSSAGASIQGRYLARATPIGNFRIMAPGYERGGLGFLGGVAIDQHFSQRGRQKDMTQLVNRYPQLLGIGLDEATAIIVTKSKAEVVGRGKVFFYNRKIPVVKGKPDYIALPAGSVYDLAERKIIKNTTSEKSDQSKRGPKQPDKNDGF